ncbi:MAG: helix-turn-helix transcriptional regulator [Pirellula sp.]|jgi:excisionase family DNA binding protein
MGKPTTAPELPRLLDVEQVAGMLGVSSRQVYRLADGGRMPRPLKIGGSVRWDRQAVEKWIAAGCPQEHGGKRP